MEGLRGSLMRGNSDARDDDNDSGVMIFMVSLFQWSCDVFTLSRCRCPADYCFW